jgi:hypothetical protein
MTPNDGMTSFIQIAAAHGQLYALDIAGRVWSYDFPLKCWRLMPMQRAPYPPESSK